MSEPEVLSSETCPWCGGELLSVEYRGVRASERGFPEKIAKVECSRCLASGPAGYGDTEREAAKDAIRKWRNRGVTEKAEEPQRRPMDSISVTVDGEKVEIPCSDMGGSNNPDVAARHRQTSAFTNTDLAAAIDYAYTRAGKTDEGLKMQHHLEILLGIQRARAASTTYPLKRDGQFIHDCRFHVVVDAARGQ